MADKARAWTDEQLKKISKSLTTEYKAAKTELQSKFGKYMAKAEKRLESLRKALSQAVAGGDKDKIRKAQEALEKAALNATLNSNRYQEMIDDITSRLADVNNTALSYVNGQMPSIYRRNYNQAGEAADEVGMTFSLMNEQALATRLREGDIRLPKKKVDIPKDKRWNTKQLNSAVLQGILQGESMDKIAKRILPIVDNNRQAAIRNARTMVTGAENEGRLDGFHQLEEDGAVLKKVWIATADSRTREAHLFLDGQEVGIDEPFVDADGNELMYPGDPSAEPSTVYNCRCSMRTHIVGFRKQDGRIEPVNYDRKSGMHQEAIDREKEKRGIEDTPAILVPDAIGPMRGVPKIEIPESYEDVVKSVNPSYEDGREWRQNCANCVVAEELRYRGYDVQAESRDFSRKDKISYFWYDTSANKGKGSWTDSFDGIICEEVGAKRKDKLQSAIEEKMREYGDGARAVIFVQWDTTQIGHYFNVVNENGKIIFIDAQNGKSNVTSYFDDARPSKTRIWRTDNKPLTEFVRKVVKWNEQK